MGEGEGATLGSGDGAVVGEELGMSIGVGICVGFDRGDGVGLGGVGAGVKQPPSSESAQHCTRWDASGLDTSMHSYEFVLIV